VFVPEQPALFVADLQRFFRTLRWACGRPHDRRL